ncbi:MAG: hypothetical protein ACFFFG_10010 [Candidatus Thorarchaeota archaeon]
MGPWRSNERSLSAIMLLLYDKYDEKCSLAFADGLHILILIGMYSTTIPLLLFIIMYVLYVPNAIFWPDE